MTIAQMEISAEQLPVRNGLLWKVAKHFVRRQIRQKLRNILESAPDRQTGIHTVAEIVRDIMGKPSTQDWRQALTPDHKTSWPTRLAWKLTSDTLIPETGKTLVVLGQLAAFKEALSALHNTAKANSQEQLLQIQEAHQNGTYNRLIDSAPSREVAQFVVRSLMGYPKKAFG